MLGVCPSGRAECPMSLATPGDTPVSLRSERSGSPSSDQLPSIAGPPWDDDHHTVEGKHVRRSTIIGAVLAGGLALAGCTPNEGPSDQPPAPGTPPPATAQQNAGADAQGSDGDHTATDREFAQQLLNNHQQVLQLASMASQNAEKPNVKALAAQLQQQAKSQLDAVTSWLGSAAGRQSGSAPEDDADQTDGRGLQTQQQLQQLSQLRGAAFDAQWRQAMVSLQQNAVQLAQTELEEGSAKQLRDLAEQVVSEQQQALNDLNALS